MTRDNGAGSTKQMPDVASNSMVDHIHTTLDWVGMSEIHLPARVSDTLAGERPVSTSIQAYVNLANADAKGIHMSRVTSCRPMKASVPVASCSSTLNIPCAVRH